MKLISVDSASFSSPSSSFPVVLPQQLLNAVPITRTPWGGDKIVEIKRSSLAKISGLAGVMEPVALPQRVGESWEISTGNPFPSRLREGYGDFLAGAPLEAVLASEPDLLGAAVTGQFGAHSPLLLKWLHAREVLSLQVHPARGDAQLRQDQEGKPESWLVMDVERGGALYLGFAAGVSDSEIVEAFEEGREREVLFRFEPKVGEYICVPPGCVHAIDAGVLVAEPQFVMPGKDGVTLRVSDWGRRYNARGEQDPNGSPRETHWRQALDTIDWALPRGEELRSRLCTVLQSGKPFFPQRDTPFPVQAFMEPGDYAFEGLVPDAYSVLTVWAGSLSVHAANGVMCLEPGETAFVSALPSKAPLGLRFSLGADAAGNCGAAFFSIDAG